MLTVAVDRDVLIGPAEERQPRFARVGSASGDCCRQQAQDHAGRNRGPTSSCDHNVFPVGELPNSMWMMVAQSDDKVKRRVRLPSRREISTEFPNVVRRASFAHAVQFARGTDEQLPVGGDDRRPYHFASAGVGPSGSRGALRRWPR